MSWSDLALVRTVRMRAGKAWARVRVRVRVRSEHDARSAACERWFDVQHPKE
jgi:hypothetical protein